MRDRPALTDEQVRLTLKRHGVPADWADVKGITYNREKGTVLIAVDLYEERSVTVPTGSALLEVPADILERADTEDSEKPSGGTIFPR